jgi:hypothetical protein
MFCIQRHNDNRTWIQRDRSALPGVSGSFLSGHGGRTHTGPLPVQASRMPGMVGGRYLHIRHLPIGPLTLSLSLSLTGTASDNCT